MPGLGPYFEIIEGCSVAKSLWQGLFILVVSTLRDAAMFADTDSTVLRRRYRLLAYDNQ